MTSLERYEYIQKNKGEMPMERIAVALRISIYMVEYYRYTYKPTFKPRKEYKIRKRPFKALSEYPTDFETNGNFDVNKWAKCLHV